MADFVAVIRRAVDGLSDNTPKMRAKVYEKARGAVLRQLESMKPRPPEEMLRRQLDKLEDAIRDVESEHAEALPTAENTGAHDEAVFVPEEQGHEAHTTAWQDHGHEPASHEAEPQGHSGPLAWEQTQAAEQQEEPHREDARPYWQDPGQSEQLEEAAPMGRTLDAGGGPVHPSAHQVVASDVREEPTDVFAPAGLNGEHGLDGNDARAQETAAYPDELYELPEQPVRRTPAERFDPAGLEDRTGRLASASDVEHPWLPAADAGMGTRSDFGDFDDEPGWEQKAVSCERQAGAVARMPEAIDLLGWEDTPFDDVPPTQVKTAGRSLDEAARYAKQAGQADAQAFSSGWNDLHNLIGEEDAVQDIGEPERPPQDLAELVAKRQTKSFRAEPKRRINYGAIVFTLAGLVLVSGGGYAAWLNREMLSGMVTGLVSSAPPTIDGGKKPADTANGTQTPAGNGKSAHDDTAAGNVASNKFTQRLLTNGTEVDEGPAQAAGEATEGKSVAQQNVAPATGATAESGEAWPETVTSNGPVQTNPAQQTLPVGTHQKMFLYEERLGQSTPTAIEGAISWSLKQEPGAGGKLEPVVQGQLTVPDRGLSALIAFKRNTDPSLPASHLVEIVFSIPKDFEGGSIDSIQRISMKQAEQDRGTPLIAVPAKITDDFHMIALNDFPDAMKSNLELLRSRDWLDIPITYRNGRRALLTLEKGNTGAEAFNAAIKEWNVLGPPSAGN